MKVVFDEDEYRHLRRIFRIGTFENFFVADGKGHLVKCILESGRREAEILEVIDTFDFTENKISLTVSCSILEKKKFEELVYKSTETGARAIQPFFCSRTQWVLFNEDRLTKIMISALKQSGRIFLPEIKKPLPLASLLSSEKAENREFCYMDMGADNTEPIELGKVKNLFIGPEGGWTEDEKQSFRVAGFQSLSIGYSTMRAETAAAVGTALIVQSQMKSLAP
ncbi:16S rRNA (uracil(1498)-N(3))-methyltransferase [candidate division WOR-3 bacterium]|nr:16S rRNA (uracil(1498)-N(3))-methyltransferase [candidate division WOR-3 bacterium]